jgi:nitronate monooxygenase
MHPLSHNLRLPLFQAPMFLLSGPAMVIAACKSGVLGSFPTPNCRTTADLEHWLQEITAAVNPKTDAAWAVNLMMHRSNSRRFEDLELAVKYRAPLVISALGSPREAVDAVHSYGGKVFADVINPLFARKALDAGVDGLVLVAAGAGGHTGPLSAFAFVEEVRQFWDGDIVLGGGISSGRGIRAAEVLGATYAYMGTRFIATEESMADPNYKQMVVDADGMDIVCSDSITGVKANWLRASLEQHGMDPDNLPPPGEIDIIKSASDARRWRDLWAAGQGVGAIRDVVSIPELVDRLVQEYQAAREA